MKLERRDGSGQSETPKSESAESPGKSPGGSRKREISVIIYTTVLFAVALALILLSYAMQKNTNSTISNMSAQHGEFSAQAMRNIEELQNENQTLRLRLDAANTLISLMSAGDGNQREKLLQRMEELSEYLDEDALEIYNSILQDLE